MLVNWIHIPPAFPRESPDIKLPDLYLEINGTGSTVPTGFRAVLLFGNLSAPSRKWTSVASGRKPIASKNWSCTKCWSNLGPSFPDTASCWRTLVQKMADESIPSWKYDNQLESSSTLYPFIPTSLSGRMSWQWTVDIFFWLEYHQNLTKCCFLGQFVFWIFHSFEQKNPKTTKFQIPKAARALGWCPA